MIGSSARTSGGRSAGLAVLLCALELEYQAVRAHLRNLRHRDHPAGTRFEIGDLPGSPWQVALAITGPGTIGAGVVADQAIGLLDPDVLMCVGVAGALKDDLELGDVVVATRVDAYHGGKVAEEFLARPRTWDASYRLDQAARHLSISDDWRRCLPAELAAIRPAVHFGPIAAGEVVLGNRDSALFAQLRQHYNDAVAIEMEGAGVALAAHINAVHALVVRGISDRADGAMPTADRAGWKQRAAAAAAGFAAALLSSLAVPPRSAGVDTIGRAVADEPLGTAAPAGDAAPVAAEHGDLVQPDGHRRAGARSALRSSGTHRPDGSPGKAGEEFIVGRADEISVFDRLLTAGSTRWLLNVFGPSGIGKSVVRRKLADHARHGGVLVGEADIGTHGGTPIELLRELTVTLRAGQDAPDDRLRAFAGGLDEYDVINEVIASCGGIDQMYDIAGLARNAGLVHAALDNVGGAPSARIRQATQNRYALERYLRAAPQRLAGEFGDALAATMDGSGSAAILLDTYEEAGTLDSWLRRALLSALPDGTRLVVFGRNALAQQNFDWADHADITWSRRLAELAEDEAKSYLRHYGLTDPVSLGQVFQFTGGYPLLLVLVRQLADFAGGWAAVGHLEASGDRDRIASQLLDRILREQRVRQVRDVLEKCAIASWLNPEIIAVLLDIDPEEARAAFEEVRRFSFMERHPEGIMLHEQIRALLVERLRFTSQREFDRLEAKLLAYHAGQAAP